MECFVFAPYKYLYKSTLNYKVGWVINLFQARGTSGDGQTVDGKDMEQISWVLQK